MGANGYDTPKANLSFFSINLYFTCDMVFTTTMMYKTKTSATPQCPEMETHQVSGAFCFNVQKNPCSGVGEKPEANGYKNLIPFQGGVVTHSHQNLYIMKKILHIFLSLPVTCSHFSLYKNQLQQP